MVDPSEQEAFKRHRFHSYCIWVLLHEILGHGTGRLLSESSPGNFNFDPQNPPLNPLTGKPVESWYRPCQTWTSVFEDLATTVDECRAEIVGAYLIDESEILGLFGYDENSEVTADDGKQPLPQAMELRYWAYDSHVQYVLATRCRRATGP